MSRRSEKIVLSLLLVFSAIAAIVFVFYRRNIRLRHQHNREALRLCAPAFSEKAAKLIDRLEQLGYSPEIGEGWRSTDAQKNIYVQGYSNVTSGRHNEVDANGKPSSSAIDLLPVSRFQRKELQFEVALACVARDLDLETGIQWGLSTVERVSIRSMIDHCDYRGGRVGWDPLHIQLVRQSKGAPAPGLAPPSSMGVDSSKSLAQMVDDAPLLAGAHPIAGDSFAPVRLVLFIDFQCEYCRQYWQTVFHDIVPTEKQKLQVILRNFPLAMRADSAADAEWMACVEKYSPKDQEAAAEFFLSHRGLPVEKAIIHSKARLTSIHHCTSQHELLSSVQADIKLGLLYGVAGTPTTFLNGERIEGAVNANSLIHLIDKKSLE